MSQQEITTTTAASDINFCFPLHDLESDRVKLTPFIPDLHTDLYLQASAAHPEIYDFFPYKDSSDFVKQIIHGQIASNPNAVLYAVIDKTRTSTSKPTLANFAGVIGYLRASPENLSADISFVIILPPFQHTHVTTNAVGLLLQYALDLPPRGLGLRRVQWVANTSNTKSISMAQKMGFKVEGILRWEHIFPGSKARAANGGREREGDPRPGTVSQDTVLLALCWDDWESERARVLQAMDRRS